jgi:Tol biopolymer transport system component
MVDLPAHQLMLVWAPDGKRLLVTKVMSPSVALASFETILLDPKTGKSETLTLPGEVRVLDWSRDGKMFLVVYRQEKKYRLGLLARGSEEVLDLTELKGSLGHNVGRLSPDGTKALYADAEPEDKEAHRWGMSTKLYMFDIAAKKRESLLEFPLNAQGLGVTWSPDGKRIAYTWKQVHRDLLKKKSLDANDIHTVTESFLMVADSDGKNAKTIASGRCDNIIKRIFGSIDWR